LVIIEDMKQHRIIFLTILSVLISGLITCDNSGDNGLISTWVQAGPDGTYIARAITVRENCPDISIDAIDVPMIVRHSPDNDFPVLVCELTLPSEISSASIAGRALKLPI